jgi:tRNA(Ile)-lysidine synthase TilS/MesJ
MDLPARVGATGLLPAGAPVVVLVSGGRDSTCLLDVAVELAGRDAVRALHVDYGLRGEESDADAAHCAALCERLGGRSPEATRLLPPSPWTAYETFPSQPASGSASALSP